MRLDTVTYLHFIVAVFMAIGLGTGIGVAASSAVTSTSESRLMEVSRKGMVSSVKISSESAVAIALALQEFKRLRHPSGSWADVARGGYPIEVSRGDEHVEVVVVQTPPFRLDDAYSFEIDTRTYSVEVVGTH